MLQSTAPVVLKVLLCTSITLCYKVLFQYFFTLLCTTKYYSSTTPRTRSTTPVLLCYYKVLLQYYSSTEKASKMIVSCEASSKFHRKNFQNERFVRSFRQFSQKEVPKWSFRARLHRNFTKEGSKTSVSREASSKFHRKNFQNERFVRSFRQFSQKEVPKWSFRARLHRNFTKEGSKTSVSREASSKFHRTSFQNERLARCFRQFRRKNFQKDRFARCFRQFSQKKLPKGPKA